VPNAAALTAVADAQGGLHRLAMASPPSRSERMELRRATGTRVLVVPRPTPYHRGPDRLGPHACFDCRKSWKISEKSSARCPECAGELKCMGRAFKAPKKADDEQWEKVRVLWNAGFRFVNHTRWRDSEPYPGRLRDVTDFIKRNADHPFRHKP
jgi:DNA-directed RNA polymerase subunit RPC12/RpoP